MTAGAVPCKAPQASYCTLQAMAELAMDDTLFTEVRHALDNRARIQSRRHAFVPWAGHR
jgi:hypothetical protein